MTWGAPRDVHFAKGNLADVSIYATTADGPLFLATSLDISADNPLPGQGLYYVVRLLGCGSWQTPLGANPARDATLP